MDAMDAKTAVSIIIPFYNGIDWLEMIFVAFGKQTFKAVSYTHLCIEGGYR